MRWLDVKSGTKEDRRQWLKLHLMVGVKTNIVTSVEVSDDYAHDYPFFKGLVDCTADAGFTMKEVSVDKGYLGADNMFAALRHGTIPYIPFKTNSVPSVGLHAEVGTVDAHVPLLRAPSCGVFRALSQTLKRRDYVPHDQGEVWTTLAEPNAYSADQRSIV